MHFYTKTQKRVSRQNLEIHFPAKTRKCVFLPKTRKCVFLPKSKNMFSHQNLKSFHAKTKKNVFFFTQKLKNVFPPKLENRKNLKTHFSCQYWKNISVKTRKCVFLPKPRERVFPRKPKKMHFSATTQKRILPPKAEIVLFFQNPKICFSAKTEKYVFSQKPKKRLSPSQNPKYVFRKTKNTFSVKPKNTFSAKTENTHFCQTP